MLQLFSRYAALFNSWQILRYEQEGKSYLLHIKARLCDGSWLVLRDYLFQDGSRKYSYHWMNADETFRRRWDNAPHWPTVPTSPHHEHQPDCEIPGASVITNLGIFSIIRGKDLSGFKNLTGLGKFPGLLR